MSTPSANFTQVPNLGAVIISAANTNRDGTGTLGTVLTAGSAGTLIRRVRFKAQVTTAAGMLRLFLDNGTTKYLFDEILTVGATPTGTVKAEMYEVAYSDFVLPTGWTLKAAPHNAESWCVEAFGGNWA